MTTPFSIIDKYQLTKPSKLIQVGASSGQELADFVQSGITHALLVEPLDMPFSPEFDSKTRIFPFLPPRP